jgi:hypothetical protein
VHVDAVGLLRSSDAARWGLLALGGVLAVAVAARRRR